MFRHVTKLRGKVQLAKEMVAKSVRKKVEETPLPVRVLSSGRTPLHDAAQNGDVSEVKALLAKGADVNAKVWPGYTPLHTAARYGHVAVAKELLSNGAEIDAKSTKGYTPLHLAAFKGHLDVVKELLTKGAQIDAKNKYVDWTPLHLAARYGHVAVAKELLSNGAEIDAKSTKGHTPLHLAALYGHADVVKELLSNGAEVDAKNKYGNTPLHLAAKYGYVAVVKMLLSKGAQLDAKNNDGETPLHKAAKQGNVDVLKALGQEVIKLAQRAKKPTESSEAPKILTDVLQEQCLPEVAEWAVNHSYGADTFPGEASTARSCVKTYMSFARARLAVGSIWSYVYPSAGAAAAAVSVCVVEPLILHHFGSDDASDHEERHTFYRGAHLLVANAAIKWYWPKMAFRLVEVMTIIAFFMGFAMVGLWWVLWLPFVGALFLFPGIKMYGRELMRAPVK